MLVGPYADPNQVEFEAWAELRQRCAHLDRAKLMPALQDRAAFADPFEVLQVDVNLHFDVVGGLGHVGDHVNLAREIDQLVAGVDDIFEVELEVADDRLGARSSGGAGSSSDSSAPNTVFSCSVSAASAKRTMP